MELRAFFSSKAGKRVLIISLIIITIGIVILILLRPAPPEERNIVSEEYDPVSGETIRILDQEPEEPSNMVHLVGFRIFAELGFTARQQDIIFSGVQNFFTENYPNILRLSYERNSVTYDATNEDIVYFRLVADTEEAFRVKIDTEGSMFRAVLSFYDDNGHLLNSL